MTSNRAYFLVVVIVGAMLAFSGGTSEARQVQRSGTVTINMLAYRADWPAAVGVTVSRTCRADVEAAIARPDLNGGRVSRSGVTHDL